jgi:hypothetical protein
VDLIHSECLDLMFMDLDMPEIHTIQPRGKDETRYTHRRHDLQRDEGRLFGASCGGNDGYITTPISLRVLQEAITGAGTEMPRHSFIGLT